MSTKRHNPIAIGLMMSLLLAACTDGEPRSDEAGGYAPIVVTGVTRGTAVSDGQLGDIQVFLTKDGGLATAGVFGFNSSQTTWAARFKLPSETQTYSIYGYMPVDAATGGSIDLADAAMPTLTVNGLNILTDDDVTVLTGVRRVASIYTETSPEACDFNFMYEGSTASASDKTYLTMLFEHISARLVIQLNVDNAYSQLRTIRLRRLQLRTTALSKATAVVRLRTTKNVVTPTGIQSVAYTTTATQAVVNVLYDGELPLPPKSGEAVSVGGVNLLPVSELADDLVMDVDYDVYDTAGTKLRTCQASNRLANVVDDLRRGEQKVVTVTVNPTYLYMLSEPDLDNPTLSVN